MPLRIASTLEMPELIPGRIVTLPGRGEMFVRHHRHHDASRPTVLLLHGWSASCDAQFFMAYEALAAQYSIVGVDHRGHGRGLRPNREFSLEDCADDAAAVVRSLGIDTVITVGYSMGGPVSLLLQRRHGELVAGMVLQATALDWNATRAERARWRATLFVQPAIRRLLSPRSMRWIVGRMIPRGHELSRFVPWLVGEMRRNDQWMINEAGRAIFRFDAHSFAGSVTVPTAVVVTTRDTVVPPVKQYELATLLRAEVIELDGDHFVTFGSPREYAAATRRAVDSVVNPARR